MPYRDSEEARRARLQTLETSLATLRPQRRLRSRELAAIRADVDALEQRYQEGGIGAGGRSWRRDRVDVAGWLLALVALTTCFAHASWHDVIAQDPTVIPAVVLLATPGSLAWLVTWPYRNASPRCRWAGRVGAVLALLVPVNLTLGMLRVFS